YLPFGAGPHQLDHRGDPEGRGSHRGGRRRRCRRGFRRTRAQRRGGRAGSHGADRATAGRLTVTIPADLRTLSKGLTGTWRIYLQDGTFVWVLQMLEWYGFCGLGEAGPFLAE